MDAISQAKDKEINGDIEGALKLLVKALGENPNSIQINIEIANLYAINGNYLKAIVFFRKLLLLKKDDESIKEGLTFCLSEVGNNYQKNRKYEEAKTISEEVLSHFPHNSDYLFNYGNALFGLNQFSNAINVYQNSIKNNLITPDPDTYINLGNALRNLDKNEEAIKYYKRALEINPKLIHAQVELAHLKQFICEWEGIESLFGNIKEHINNKRKGKISPFTVLSMPNLNNKEYLTVATAWSEQSKIEAMQTITTSINDKLTIGYLSADFRKHPLYYLIIDILKNHERNKFNIKLFYSGPYENSNEYKEFIKLKYPFINLSTKSDAESAKIIRDEKVDILVDLSGFTKNSRSMIAAYKPARYHINWLGFPGSMGFHHGKPLFDFILSDKYIISGDAGNDYAEKVLYLPHCYQPNVKNRPSLAFKTKKDYGFSEETFIYASFGQSIKITKNQFNLWINLLKKSPKAHLWLLEANKSSKDNLWMYAEQRGIDKKRIRFAPKVSIEEHINRHQIIDLFLDTFPYNAHTSTSDAIWAKCPVLTLSGQTFASRVAGSILREIDCNELITGNEDEYFNKALELYKSPKELSRIKQKIIIGKINSVIFKPNVFTNNLEKIYSGLFTS